MEIEKFETLLANFSSVLRAYNDSQNEKIKSLYFRDLQLIIELLVPCIHIVNKKTIEIKDMEWISIKDRLPEEYQNVLCIGKASGFLFPHELTLLDDEDYQMYLVNYNKGEWTYDENCCAIMVSYVIYWMPLPTFPEIISEPNQLTNYLMDKFELVLKKLSDS